MLPLCFFMVGWELFVIGFGWLLSTSSDNMPISYWSPYCHINRSIPLSLLCHPSWRTIHCSGWFASCTGNYSDSQFNTLLPLCFMIGWGLFAANFSWLLGTSNNLVMLWGVTLSYIVHHQEPTLPSITCTSF